MTKQQAGNPACFQSQPDHVLRSVLLLDRDFFYRAVVPAHEYPRRVEQVMAIALDALCLVGLLGTRASGARALLWIALIAGIGLFALRLAEEPSWSTGHWSYSLLPR